MLYKVLVTCPPMLGMFDEFVQPARELGLALVPVKTNQTLSEKELVALLPDYDGWIIGDDPATYHVFEQACRGRLKAAVKWGIGVDNVDFEACDSLKIPITNTPDMFGAEVAELAIGYLVGLTRQTHLIDREIRLNNTWPKPAGMSISGKHVGVIGFGDIGTQVVKRLSGFDVHVTVYDPSVVGNKDFLFVQRKAYPEGIEQCDFLIFTCSLNEHNVHMLNDAVLSRTKKGVLVVNVARGPLIDESALIERLKSGDVAGAALDVFELEPLPQSSLLRTMPNCIFGSHNGSNTKEAVRRASHEAIGKLAGFLNAQ